MAFYLPFPHFPFLRRNRKENEGKENIGKEKMRKWGANAKNSPSGNSLRATAAS
jgi:hypothetical protein